jgi:hypothetical protein
MAQFRCAADMVVRAATALIPYQSPRRLRFLLPPPSRCGATVDIFNDNCELVDLSEQRNVRQDDLPLPIDHVADGVRQEG